MAITRYVLVRLTVIECVSLQRISSSYTWSDRYLAGSEGQCCVQAAAKCGLPHWTCEKLYRFSYYNKFSPHCETHQGENWRCTFVILVGAMRYISDFQTMVCSALFVCELLILLLLIFIFMHSLRRLHKMNV
jgi:hypothetical protein